MVIATMKTYQPKTIGYSRVSPIVNYSSNGLIINQPSSDSFRISGMTLNQYYPTILLLLVIFLVGCEKEEVENYPPSTCPYPPVSYAYIQGELRDETTYEPISDVGVIAYGSMASDCGYIADTTDANGNFLLRVCRTNCGDFPVPYSNVYQIIIYDTQSASSPTYQEVEYVNTESIQTGDTLHFTLYTTVEF